jgi:hypothetical protein
MDVSINGTLKINGSAWLSLVYPVGSIYMSVSSTNPTNYFGGSWSLWGAGRVPVCVNTSDSDFSTVQKTGGSKTVTLSTSQIPSHQHSVYTEWGTDVNLTTNPTSQTYMQLAGTYAGTRSVQSTPVVSGGGSGGSHTNLQPYITCYMWRRTA